MSEFTRVKFVYMSKIHPGSIQLWCIYLSLACLSLTLTLTLWIWNFHYPARCSNAALSIWVSFVHDLSLICLLDHDLYNSSGRYNLPPFVLTHTVYFITLSCRYSPIFILLAFSFGFQFFFKSGVLSVTHFMVLLLFVEMSFKCTKCLNFFPVAGSKHRF